MRPTSTKRRAAILLTAFLAFGLGACSDDGDDTDDATESPADDATDDATDGATDDADEAGDDDGAAAGISIIGISEGFEVAGTVAPGSTVVVVNTDGSSHTVTSADDAWEQVTLSGGESGEFVAPAEADEYSFVCSFHSNMQGTITVG